MHNSYVVLYLCTEHFGLLNSRPIHIVERFTGKCYIIKLAMSPACYALIVYILSKHRASSVKVKFIVNMVSVGALHHLL